MTSPETREGQFVPWHSDARRRCLTCVEHGGPFDGGCDNCGYADPRWVKRCWPDQLKLWEPIPMTSPETREGEL